jgi:hypothetical protein
MLSIGMHIFNDDIYRITVAMKVKTKSISSIAASLIWTRCDTSDNVYQDLQNWRYYFHLYCHNVFEVTVTNIFQYQSQVVDTDNITL